MQGIETSFSSKGRVVFSLLASGLKFLKNCSARSHSHIREMKTAAFSSPIPQVTTANNPAPFSQPQDAEFRDPCEALQKATHLTFSLKGSLKVSAERHVVSTCRGKKPELGMTRFEERWHGFRKLQNAPDRASVPKLRLSYNCCLNARNNSNANWDGPRCLGSKALTPFFEGYSMPILTFATKIRWTGSESSNTTKPKLGSFPPTPLVFMRSSTTFPKPGKTRGKSHVTKNPQCQLCHPSACSRQHL